MKKRILIAPNSFKECIDSVTLTKLFEVFLSVQKNLEIIKKPISDGGDGFLNVCKFHFGGEIRKYKISRPYGDTKFECPILYSNQLKEIYIESAEILGLKVVPKQFRNPLNLSSKGLGELLSLLDRDTKSSTIEVDKVYIGIGGTVTIDLGLGMMSKLGIDLFDSDKKELAVLPKNLALAKAVKFKVKEFHFNIIPIIDVSNSLLGMDGGVWVYGPQKGANEKELSIIENSFVHILNLLKNNNLRFSSNKLSGAGGGIPAALQLFYNSPMMKSSEYILNKLKIGENPNEVDYIITGEGAYDHQSNYEKGAGVIVENFQSKVNKIFLVCGRIEPKSIFKFSKNVIPIELRNYFKSEQESIEKLREGIERASEEILKEINF